MNSTSRSGSIFRRCYLRVFNDWNGIIRWLNRNVILITAIFAPIWFLNRPCCGHKPASGHYAYQPGYFTNRICSFARHSGGQLYFEYHYLLIRQQMSECGSSEGWKFWSVSSFSIKVTKCHYQWIPSFRASFFWMASKTFIEGIPGFPQSVFGRLLSFPGSEWSRKDSRLVVWIDAVKVFP